VNTIQQAVIHFILTNNQIKITYLGNQYDNKILQTLEQLAQLDSINLDDRNKVQLYKRQLTVVTEIYANLWFKI
jgi:hypothetical protein